MGICHGWAPAAFMVQRPTKMVEVLAADGKTKIKFYPSDIKALANNPNGFSKDSWVPYLGVSYELTHLGTNASQKGEFMPMVANDGPHYGDNVKLNGPGKYRLKLTISPPSENKHAHFGRHTDKETGTGEWFKIFNVEYDFTYAGTGKKGAY